MQVEWDFRAFMISAKGRYYLETLLLMLLLVSIQATVGGVLSMRRMLFLKELAGELAMGRSVESG